MLGVEGAEEGAEEGDEEGAEEGAGEGGLLEPTSFIWWNRLHEEAEGVRRGG
jgi:hypothetical protein